LPIGFADNRLLPQLLTAKFLKNGRIRNLRKKPCSEGSSLRYTMTGRGYGGPTASLRGQGQTYRLGQAAKRMFGIAAAISIILFSPLLLIACSNQTGDGGHFLSATPSANICGYKNPNYPNASVSRPDPV
jgi:hypothetical protein